MKTNRRRHDSDGGQTLQKPSKSSMAFKLRTSARKLLRPSILAYEIMYRTGNKTWKQSRHSISSTELSHANLLEIHTKVETALILETIDRRRKTDGEVLFDFWLLTAISFSHPFSFSSRADSQSPRSSSYFRQSQFQSQFPIGSIAQFRKEALMVHAFMNRRSEHLSQA